MLCAMCRRECVFIWIYMWFTNVVLNMCAAYIVIAVVHCSDIFLSLFLVYCRNNCGAGVKCYIVLCGAGVKCYIVLCGAGVKCWCEVLYSIMRCWCEVLV